MGPHTLVTTGIQIDGKVPLHDLIYVTRSTFPHDQKWKIGTQALIFPACAPSHTGVRLEEDKKSCLRLVRDLQSIPNGLPISALVFR